MVSSRVRPIVDDELAGFIDVVRTAFLTPPASADAVAARRETTDIGRCIAAFDGGGRMCGAARAFATPLTVPGGEVAAGAVSSVGVLPTHTRQGHLTRLMRHQLADIAERGEPVAVLIAAEYPIYGRYGYGPATEAVGLRVDARAAVWREPATGSVEIVDDETFAKVMAELYDRVRRVTPGHIGWTEARWRIEAGVTPFHDGDDDNRRNASKVVWRDGSGEPQAATSYRIDDSWVHNRPANTLRAEPLVAASARAEHELLRFLAGIDWVTEVRVGLRPVDDPAPLALVDGRTVRLVDRSDQTWLRVLDVPAALSARTYASSGSVVIEVDDPLGFAHGRFRLDAGHDGAECAPTTAAADLAVTAPALGAAYLGGQGWARLADAGWVDERRPGAVAEAAALFAPERAPGGARQLWAGRGARS
ncbi:MAG: GNAT family N-acetyltransferase, partial [Acidimicrobiales bacterium]|nr:GNAT family N-acetyltransferase [Acidimicrobiales bacterium]